MFQTCDACFKNVEPLLQKVIENFNKVVTALDPIDNHDISDVLTNGNSLVQLLNRTPS